MSAVDADLLHSLETALARLPALQRDILIAHRIEGLTYREIASLLGVSEHYVERQMAKAICKLAKQLDGEKLRWWERWL